MGCSKWSIGFGLLGLIVVISECSMGHYKPLFEFSWVYLACIFFPVAFIFIKKKLEDQTKAEIQVANKKAEEVKALERERREKANLILSMMNLVKCSNDNVLTINALYRQILDTIPEAENALDKAEDEFNGGFYAPFWDQIESATNQLALYNDYLLRINSCVDQYWKNVQSLDDKYNDQVVLCVLPGKLPDPKRIAKRLATTVRMAQRNFEFSTIYEQRKTNKLLYEGFRNLGDAIYSLGDRITDSLNDLSRNLDSSLSDIISATNENSRIIGDNIQEQTRRIDEHADAQRRYESDSLRNQSEQQKTLEQQKRVLDSQNRRINNIQSGRKPGLLDE